MAVDNLEASLRFSQPGTLYKLPFDGFSYQHGARAAEVTSSQLVGQFILAVHT